MRFSNVTALLVVASAGTAASAFSRTPAFSSRATSLRRHHGNTSSNTALHVSTAPPPTKEEAAIPGGGGLPPRGDDGIYHIANKEQHQ